MNCPIHSSGHILDLIITKYSNSDSILSLNVFSDAPSDHSHVICDILFPRPKSSKKRISPRKIVLLKLSLFLKVFKKLTLVQIKILWID